MSGRHFRHKGGRHKRRVALSGGRHKRTVVASKPPISDRWGRLDGSGIGRPTFVSRPPRPVVIDIEFEVTGIG